MGPTGKTRIVQIHPTRKCNLSCKHCYSSSSPHAKESIAADILKDAIDDLAEQGYEWISFSGGEPLVYDPLPEVLSHAQTQGLNSTLVSNGMLLTGSRLESIAEKISGLVISLDGKPDSHNQMRNSPRAFETMRKNLPELVQREITFAFLFTLTQHNLDELPWVVDFSLGSGANGLLVHPLEITGNATSQLAGKSPDATEMAAAWAWIDRIKTRYERFIKIDLDLVHTSALTQVPEHFFLADWTTARLEDQLADLLSILVIEPDGEVVPLQYGFPRQYSLGNLYEQRISDMVDNWRYRVGPMVQRLSRDLCRSLTQTMEDHSNKNGQFINWYEQMDRLARQTHSVPLTSLTSAVGNC